MRKKYSISQCAGMERAARDLKAASKRMRKAEKALSAEWPLPSQTTVLEWNESRSALDYAVGTMKQKVCE